MPVIGSSPVTQTSRKQIIYKDSSWKVHRFCISSGETIADVEVLKMSESLLLWVSSPRGREFTELAIGVPAVYKNGSCERKAAATTLLGPINSAQSSELARRLASCLRKHVYVSCNVHMDRFIGPMIEKGLMMEIKKRPECF